MKILRLEKANIKKKLFQGRAVVLYGPRRTGKTTLVNELLEEYCEKRSRYIDMEDPDMRNIFENIGIQKLELLLNNIDLIVFDEAQKLKNIGQTLKLIVDHLPEKQVIATGSSSFELSNEVNEPLTGRKYVFHLYPISIPELFASGKAIFDLQPMISRFLIYGMYPTVIFEENSIAKENLRELSQSYLFKDILSFKEIRNPEMLKKLLQLLAFQIGSEVSYHELSQKLRINEKTVEKYIHLLEEAFIIFRLPGFSRNLRKELTKKNKIYFWDLGIRNALINNLNELELRNDVGGLWENFVIAERMKYLAYTHQYRNTYFWRTYDKKEIDYIEEYNGQLDAYEIKWKTRASKKTKLPKLFLETYENSQFNVIDQDNIFEFIS